MQRRFTDFFNSEVSRKSGACTLAFEPQGLDPLITGFSYDSRSVLPGHLYFALPGLHTDGHRFIDQAIQAGAHGIVCQDIPQTLKEGILYLQVSDSRFAMSPITEAFYGSPSKSLAAIGVTGTEGKSTTVYLIYQLLELAGKHAGFISTVQHKTGKKVQWNQEHQTTPEAPMIQRALAVMRDSGMDYCVLECSSHGLSERTNRLGDVAFDVGVMTNVTHEHLEFHGTWEQYRNDKAHLFRALDLNSHEKAIKSAPVSLEGTVSLVRIPSFGVSNADDPSTEYFSSVTGRRIYTYSVRGADADLSLRNIESTASGNTYEVKVRSTGEILVIRDKLPGAFNAGNVLAALLCISGLLDLPVSDFVPLVMQLKPVRGRMTVVDLGQPFEVLVDYAHTPSSFETVLPPLKKRIEDQGGKVISLFGSGGERDREKRPRQGRIAADWTDVLVLSDEDPRGEDPLSLLEEIAAGCPERKRDEDLFLIPHRPTALRKAFSLAKPGDAVLLLGKGHENSIIYGDRATPYDEIEEAEKALTELGYGRKKSRKNL